MIGKTVLNKKGHFFRNIEPETNIKEIKMNDVKKLKILHKNSIF